MMIDIHLIRHNSERVRENNKKRNVEIDLSMLQKIEEERLVILKEVEQMRAVRNENSKKIGMLMKDGKKDEAEILKQEMKNVGDTLDAKEEDLRGLQEKTNSELLYIPNILDDDVPVGTSDEDNQEIKRVGDIPQYSFEPKDHVDLGETLGILDLKRAAKISSARFALLSGKGARLERALINFMLDIHTKEHGYTEVFPPLMVNRATMTGTGQLPKFEEDLFKTTNESPYYLIPTAEVPVTNIYQDETLNEKDLPQYFTAFTPCFRAEAGAYGKDTRGIIRQHQFNKVELVKFVYPDKSDEEHEKLLANAEEILIRLNIPYRIVTLCSGDTGFSAAKTYDIEVYLPSQKCYREISSVSNFRDFQARRANIRFKPSGGGKTEFVHTLNGSGLAVGRTWLAILENYQNEDGSVTIPEALVPYTDFDKIEKA